MYICINVYIYTNEDTTFDSYIGYTITTFSWRLTYHSSKAITIYIHINKHILYDHKTPTNIRKILEDNIKSYIAQTVKKTPNTWSHSYKKNRWPTLKKSFNLRASILKCIWCRYTVPHPCNPDQWIYIFKPVQTYWAFK